MGRAALLFLMAVTGVAAGGCNPADPFGVAEGTTHLYHWTDAKVRIGSAATVAVAVRDRRPYVLAGEKSPTFVGVVRQGFGVPFDATTESGDALAADFGRAIVAALAADNMTAKAVSVSPRFDKKAALEALLGETAERYVLVTLEEWKTDTYWRTALHYAVELDVYGRGGVARASRKIGGKDASRSDALTPKGRSRETAPLAFKKVLETLFNDPKIVAALR